MKIKLSIQVAARTLRYDFFHTLLQEEPYDAIATAHHQDDNIETVLFHFFRGTGLRGLTGIPLESPSLVRPLLHTTKKEILQYASKHHITNEADVKALARAGCDIVWMGAESGSQKILNAMDKGTTVEQIAEATRRLHEVGVRVAFFLQFGYPGETREDLEKTLQMVRDCQPDEIGMSVSYPLPGTKFHNNVKLQLGDKQNWVDSADLEMMY